MTERSSQSLLVKIWETKLEVIKKTKYLHIGTNKVNFLQKLQNRAAGIITESSFDMASKPLIKRLRVGDYK